jgi:hypothetical protein
VAEKKDAKVDGPAKAVESTEQVSMAAADVKLLQEAASRSIELDAQVTELRQQLAAHSSDRGLIDDLTGQLADARSRLTVLSENSASSNVEAAEIARLRQELNLQAEQNIALQEECKQLRNERIGMQHDLDRLVGQLREVSTGGETDHEPVPTGHIRVITLDVFVHEATGRAARTVPKGAVLTVPESTLKAENLRRFPRLEEYEIHRCRASEKTRQELAPIEAGRATLDQILRQAELTANVRKIEMAERSRAIVNAASDKL